MKVLATLSEKGGAGKTTFAVHLGVAGYLAGLDVAILDTDAQQASAADWCDRRGAPPEGAAVPHVRLKKTLAALEANGTALVIIDTGRDNNSAAYAAAEVADLCLIPMQPGGFDVRALKLTIDVCRLAGKRPVAVVNGTQPGAKLKIADAWETLAGFDCDVAPVVLPRRDIFRAASITTRTAQETEPGGPAAEEISRLYEWVAGQLGLSTTPEHDKATA